MCGNSSNNTCLDVAPEQTHALLVGVEKYNDPAWVIEGKPADTVVEFSEYLLSKGVPSDNIRFLLSTDRQLAPPENATDKIKQQIQALLANAAEPTADVFRQVVSGDFRERKGELLIVYWCGHGAINEKKERRLYFSNATSALPVNLDFSSFLLSLGSVWFDGANRDRPMRQQVFLVDACAVREQEEIKYETPSDVLSIGEPAATIQAAVFSAQLFEPAPAGFFWQTVGPRLRNDPNLPPDIHKLEKDLEAAATRLPEEESRKIKFSFWHWDKREKGSLVDYLQTKLSYKEVTEASKIVGDALDEDRIHSFFVASCPDPGMADPNRRTMYSCLEFLGNCHTMVEGQLTFPFVDFVEMVALSVGSPQKYSQLQEWLKRIETRLVITPAARTAAVERAKAKLAERADCAILLSVLPPKQQTAAGDPSVYELKAWTFRGDQCKDLYPKDNETTESLSLIQLESKISEVITRGENELRSTTPIKLELFLAEELLRRDFSAKPITPVTYPLAAEYEVTVRPYPRPGGVVANLASRRAELRSKLEQAASDTEFDWVVPGEQEQDLYGRLKNDQTITGVALPFNVAPNTDWFAVINHVGMPVVVWIRDEADLADDLLAELTGPFNRRPSADWAADLKDVVAPQPGPNETNARMCDLPQLVMQARRTAWTDKSNPLNLIGLLWEGSDRYHPDDQSPLG